MLKHALIAAALAAAATLPAPRAQAIEYPWCAQQMPDGGRNCGFVSLEQCMRTALGGGAYCVRNSFYEGPADGPPRRKTKPRPNQG